MPLRPERVSPLCHQGPWGGMQRGRAVGPLAERTSASEQTSCMTGHNLRVASLPYPFPYSFPFHLWSPCCPEPFPASRLFPVCLAVAAALLGIIWLCTVFPGWPTPTRCSLADPICEPPTPPSLVPAIRSTVLRQGRLPTPIWLRFCR